MILANIPLWLVLIGVLIAAPIVFSYIFAASELGLKLASKLMGRFAACLLIAVVVLAAFGLLPRGSRANVVLAFLLIATGFIWGHISAFLRTRAYKGEVLLDVGRTKTANINFVIIIGFMLLVLVCFVLDSMQEGINLELFARTVFFLSLGAFSLFASFDGPKFTVRGVLWMGNMICWQEVTAYQWQQGHRGVLILCLRKRSFLSNKIYIPMPAYYKQNVEDILSTHVPFGS